MLQPTISQCNEIFVAFFCRLYAIPHIRRESSASTIRTNARSVLVNHFVEHMGEYSHSPCRIHSIRPRLNELCVHYFINHEIFPLHKKTRALKTGCLKKPEFYRCLCSVKVGLFNRTKPPVKFKPWNFEPKTESTNSLTGICLFFSLCGTAIRPVAVMTRS